MYILLSVQKGSVEKKGNPKDRQAGLTRTIYSTPDNRTHDYVRPQSTAAAHANRSARDWTPRSMSLHWL